MLHALTPSMKKAYHPRCKGFLGLKGPKTVDRGQKSEVGRQWAEDRGRRAEDRGQRTEVRGQKSEDRGQKSEDRGQRTEVRSQKSEDGSQKHNHIFRIQKVRREETLP